jgi:hypothetical protein
MIVWKHHVIKQDSGFRFFREAVAEHRRANGVPIIGKHQELIAYEPTDSGPQRYWFLCASVPNDGCSAFDEVPGNRSFPVDPLNIPHATEPKRKAATRNARALMAARHARYSGERKRSLFGRLLEWL